MRSSSAGGDGVTTGERTVAREAPFHGFGVGRHVPGDRLPRSIDRLADLSGPREQRRPSPARRAGLGRPRAADPPAAGRLLLVASARSGGRARRSASTRRIAGRCRLRRRDRRGAPARLADRPDEVPADGFRYRASMADCTACPLEPRCCPGAADAQGDALTGFFNSIAQLSPFNDGSRVRKSGRSMVSPHSPTRMERC